MLYPIGLIILAVLFSTSQICANSNTERAYYLRISERKCEEYKELFREEFNILTHPHIKVEYGEIKCPTFPAYHDGKEVKLSQFPAMVSLLYLNETGNSLGHKCGGVLISEEFVLTAAHCIKNNASPIRAVLGEINISLPRSDEGSFHIPFGMSVSDVIIHENYKAGGRDSPRQNDIALVRLSQPIILPGGPNAAIRPACLQLNEIGKENIMADEAVFGPTKIGKDASCTLQTVKLPILPKQNCSHANTNTDFQSMVLCVGGAQGINACHNDSTGVLFISPDVKYPCHRYIVGIRSVDPISSSNSFTVLYTKVSSYIDWIEKHVWPTLVDANKSLPRMPTSNATERNTDLYQNTLWIMLIINIMLC